jgi:ATP-dependent Clp protease ATP-binding subunit ClpC
MWQRFSERARRAVFYAQEEAQRFGEAYVSTEHLLLGLLRQTDSLACRLIEHWVAPSALKEEVEKVLHQDEPLAYADMTLTPRAKRVIDRAYHESQLRGDEHIGSEHLLLGLIQESDCFAGRVLARNGLNLAAVREVLGPRPTES